MPNMIVKYESVICD